MLAGSTYALLIFKPRPRRHLSYGAPGITFALLFLSIGIAAFAPAAPAASSRCFASCEVLRPGFAIADFDRDGRPDTANADAGRSGARDSRYRIVIELSSGLRRTLQLSAPAGGLRLVARDVNGDDFVDVVVTTAWTNQPVAVLLNDGRGSFQAAIPSRFPNAFLASSDSLSSTPDEIAGTPAALFSRGLFGFLDREDGIRKPSNAAGLRIPRVSCSRLSYAVEPYRGRAPPQFSF